MLSPHVARSCKSIHGPYLSVSVKTTDARRRPVQVTSPNCPCPSSAGKAVLTAGPGPLRIAANKADAPQMHEAKTLRHSSQASTTQHSETDLLFTLQWA